MNAYTVISIGELVLTREKTEVFGENPSTLPTKNPAFNASSVFKIPYKPTTLYKKLFSDRFLKIR